MGTDPLCDGLNECAGVAKVALALFMLCCNKVYKTLGK